MQTSDGGVLGAEVQDDCSMCANQKLFHSPSLFSLLFSITKFKAQQRNSNVVFLKIFSGVEEGLMASALNLTLKLCGWF